ncbi:sulfurtransferase complex subunit TusB [Candidatus Enterovibrio altilux]|uniref:tRNA 5-methylaminomethyl-2-thiouridine synthase TusB n=1 Tax=Candidatus Enterovibrio altilux TaxID=1927128 RepID=A0A291BA06_9GAMM|nr:sulfurtransferase complex subunit TusB [Candidatus Enterovibrio luxaltus]ATF09825.1 tRNA 5-methylaminomethyl-2-thiouridine synthase TusB [Candidatus Enterovibrio luxaltus]
MLHTIYTSPYATSSLGLCLNYAQKNSEILLAEDAVIAAVEQGYWYPRLISSGYRVYALVDDLNARGLTTKIGDGIELVDIKGFINLTENHFSQIKW